MGDKIDKNKLNETYTEFGGTTRRNSWFYPGGAMGKFFSKFFATKSKPYVVGEFEDGEGPTKPPHPVAGDTVINTDTIAPEAPSCAANREYLPKMTEQELDRRKRYAEFEVMDEYPEITASFDTYADDCTQKDTDNRRWIIESDDDLVKDEVDRLFKKVRLDTFYWDIVRNTVKYGDCFTESVVNLNNPKAGIQRLKILNPNYIFRVENEYGYLTDFLQEIPEKTDWASYGMASHSMKDRKFISLDRNQITHFRLHTSDPYFYRYGKSIAAGARQIHRSLKLMEDAMLIYRLARAPERRIFYLDVGNMPTSKANLYVENVKAKFKKEKYYNHNSGNIDARYNPMSASEDFYFPVQKGSTTKIETLRGAENLGEVDDVKYFRDKLLAILKVPKDYIVEKDKSPERKANLSQLDVKFAKVIVRIEQSVELGFESVAKRHLQLKGFPRALIDEMRVRLPEPSDMFIKRRLDLDEQKARVVQAVMGLGLFDKKKIYNDYYDMTEKEIEDMIESVKEEQQEQMEQEMAMNPEMGGMGGGAMGGMGIPGEELSMNNPNEMTGGMAPAENTPPTSESSNVLEKLRKKMLLEGSCPEKISLITKRISREKIKNEIRE